MAHAFLTFRKFHQQEIANDLIQKLRELHIEFEVEDSDKSPDPSIVANTTVRDISIKLKPGDFTIAQKELENHYRSQAEHVDPGYYLFEFTFEELKEIIEKPGEWSDFDYQLARIILRDRGKEINAESIANLQKKRNDGPAIPGPYHKWGVYFGYFSAILGGVFGIIIGWHLYYSKKTSPDGRSVYRYGEWERIHGKLILLLGNIFLSIWIIIQVKYQSENY
ncbi:MAG: hypothetical protein ABI863_22535 [Ginsengibacter sp.]